MVMKSKGGDGAFREFVETVLKMNGLLETALQKYLEQQKGLEQ
jgi:3-deoxy-D-manno-octulosonate 8-phosphate phosphatase KdsC-like HAD superfamily phosphatase